ncbi:hypothetical protein [Scopulibacillus cellulosilyticus]|uniref:Uncharacterized protein n=1 Tax=Scopulibacillus cellulosilyticus TaxID=2665665 RepID=A0ABW2PTT6_9BACL
MLFHHEIVSQSICAPEQVLIPEFLLNAIEHLLVVKQDVLCPKSDIYKYYSDKNENQLVLLLNPIDPETVNGFFEVEKKTGVVIEQIFKKIKHDFKHIEYVDLMDLKTESQHKQILFLAEEKEKRLTQAQKTFIEAKNTLNNIYTIYDEATDPDQIQKFINDLYLWVSPLLDEEENKEKDIQSCYFRSQSLFHLTLPFRDIKQKVILKGHYRTGISYCLKVLENKIKQLNQAIIRYHCPLYSNDADMLYLSNQNLAIIDGMDPHRFEPIHPLDKTFNLDEQCIDLKKILLYTKEINDAMSKYNKLLSRATLILHSANVYQKQYQHIMIQNNPGLEKLFKM